MRVKLTAAAFALLFSVLTVQAPVGAQGQAVPIELDAVADALGMLRGMGRDDLILTVEFSGAGTMSVVGEGAEPSGPWPQHKVTRYDVSIAYDMAGMRVNLERVGPDGAFQEEILAVSGPPCVERIRARRRTCRWRGHRHAGDGRLGRPELGLLDASARVREGGPAGGQRHRGDAGRRDNRPDSRRSGDAGDHDDGVCE